MEVNKQAATFFASRILFSGTRQKLDPTLGPSCPPASLSRLYLAKRGTSANSNGKESCTEAQTWRFLALTHAHKEVSDLTILGIFKAAAHAPEPGVSL